MFVLRRSCLWSKTNPYSVVSYNFATKPKVLEVMIESIHCLINLFTKETAKSMALQNRFWRSTNGRSSSGQLSGCHKTLDGHTELWRRCVVFYCRFAFDNLTAGIRIRELDCNNNIMEYIRLYCLRNLPSFGRTFSK